MDSEKKLKTKEEKVNEKETKSCLSDAARDNISSGDGKGTPSTIIVAVNIAKILFFIPFYLPI